MERRCVCCTSRFTLLHNKDQRYCNKQACQKKRRSAYQKQKLKADSDYKETHESSQKKWRDKNPDYWQQYRSQHPTYAESNRKKQTARNAKRSKHLKNSASLFLPLFVNPTIFAIKPCAKVIANMYSLFPNNIIFSCSYECILPGGTKIANMYSIALMRQQALS